MKASDADAIIVGAGIQGATLAWEMARRGLSAVVVERAAPGAANTAASFGILHGGLRYLQQLDFARWLRSHREQHWFGEALPDLVQPLRVVMPLYRGSARTPWLFRSAFAFDALAMRALHRGADRTSGLILRPADLPAYPVPRAGLIAAAQWQEVALTDGCAAVHRLLAQARAHLVQAEASELIAAGRSVAGLRVASPAGTMELRAPAVILCAGAETRALAQRLDRDLPRLASGVLAFNLLLDRPPPPVALALSARAGRGRSLFLRACGDRLLAGTWYAPCPDHPGAVVPSAVEPALVDRALAELGACVPQLQAAREHIVEVRWGRLPDADYGAGHRLRQHDVVIEHRRHGGPSGLWSVLGVKLTTARALSARVADRVWPARRTAAPAALVHRPAAGDSSGN